MEGFGGDDEATPAADAGRDSVGPLMPDGNPMPDGAADPDAGRPDGAQTDAMPPGMGFPVRQCAITLRHRAPGARDVRIAGDFTSWGDRAIPMSDADGDGTFEAEVTPAMGAIPGRVHAYKLMVDGNWQLDQGSTYRKYDGECLNSGFRMPECEARPEIVAEPIASAVTGTTGSADIAFTVHLASDGAMPRDVAVTLDGEAVAADAITLDETRGRYALSLPNLALGRHVARVRVKDAMGRDAEPVDLPFWLETTPFDWRDTTMYMLVVDRFANGDKDIDDPVGIDYSSDWHGGDLWGALEVMRSGYFENLGVRAIWLSPINTQANGSFTGREDTNLYAGYHGYWPTRGREVEPRFGGNEALAAFVDEAHRRGIRVLFDLINNQVHEQHEYYLAHPEWFRTGCVCAIDPACGWSERPLDCLFARYLPDINWRVPEAEAQFIDDAVYWIDQFGIDGYRIDAVKHVETNSIFNLRATVARRFEQGGTRVLMVGETAVGQWDSVDYGCGESYPNGYAWIDAYTGSNGLDGQFDFPSHHRMQSGIVGGTMGYDELETIVAEAESMYRPEGLHVRFLGSHDMSRMATRAERSPKTECRWQSGGGDCASLATIPTDGEAYARLGRAFTVLMTLPGIPFLYYGDEVAIAGGNDPDNRRDMIFDDALGEVAMSSSALSAQQSALREHVAALGRARRDSVALRRGDRLPLLSERDLYVVAYRDATSGEVAVAVANRGAGINRRSVPAALLAGAGTFERVAGAGTVAMSGGSLDVTLGAGESGLFVAR